MFKNFFANFLSYFFKKQPYLGILLLFIILFTIDIWVEKSPEADNLYNYIIYYVFDVVRLPIFYTVLVVVWIVTSNNDTIKKYEDEINQQAMAMIKVNNESAVLKARTNFLTVMKKFVDNQPHVHATQLYGYTIRHIGSSTKITLRHVDGYVEEEIELNALLQTYYSIDKKLFKEFSSALARLEDGDFVPIVTFLQTHNRELSGLCLADITKADFMKLSFLELADDILENKYEIITGRTLEPVTVQKIKDVGEKQRTGILRGILIKRRFYTFRHTGIGGKQGRLYLTRYINIRGMDHMFLITIDPDILTEQDHEKQLEELQDIFSQEINKASNLEYNSNIK